MTERIFEEFEQAGEPGKTMGGLGLGLTIGKRLAEAQGGTIRAESAGKGKGSTFTIELVESTEPAVVQTRASNQQEARPPGPKRRILLVDDHVDTSNALRMLLERQGYEVITAYSAAEALRTISEASVDLIISDIGMPDESGHEMLPKMRNFTSVPAIALSGFGSDEDIQRSRDAGFQEHMIKPVKLHALTEQVARLLDATTNRY